MDLSVGLKVVHALTGIWLVAGLAGRYMTLAQAARAKSIADVHALLALSDRFERIVVRVPPLVLLLGIATAIVQGRPFLGPLQGAGINWLFVSLVVFLSIIPLIPLVFIPRGRLFGAALDEASRRGEVTAELTQQFRDPVVMAAHVYELVAILIVVVLMIAKPF